MSRCRLLALPLAAAALLLPSAPAGAATCAGADTQIASATLPSARAAVFCIVNAERTARGLGALTQNDKLELAAQRHTDDMVARNFFDHFAPDPAPNGTDPGDRITAAGYEWWSYGENIAAGYRTPRDVMTGWMKSTGHCHNILDPGFTQLGVGVASPAATISRAVGTWTQDFGRPSGTRAPSSDTGPQDACSASTTLIGPGTALSPPATEAPIHTTTPTTPTTPVGTTPADPTGGDDATATPATPAVQSAPLALLLRHAGRRLTVSGTLTGAGGTRVRITIRRAGRVVWNGTARLRNDGFRLRFKVARTGGPFTVLARAGLQRVTSTIA